jgi:DNA-binding MarR family transcriptional regulator
MPSASLTANAPHDGRKVDQPDADELLKQADQLLTVMASIRRSGRLLARRPVELSTLTGSQIDLVSLVRRRPGVSVAQAAEELQLAPNTVSTLVRQLTDERLLLRRVDPIDRRVARLELTAGMQRKVGAFLDRRLAMLGTAMNRLSTGDQRRLTDSLAALVRLAERLKEQETTNG